MGLEAAGDAVFRGESTLVGAFLDEDAVFFVGEYFAVDCSRLTILDSRPDVGVAGNEGLRLNRPSSSSFGPNTSVDEFFRAISLGLVTCFLVSFSNVRPRRCCVLAFGCASVTGLRRNSREKKPGIVRSSTFTSHLRRERDPLSMRSAL